MHKNTMTAWLAVLLTVLLGMLGASEGTSSKATIQLGGVYKFECRSQHPVTWYTGVVHTIPDVIPVCNSTQGCTHLHQIQNENVTHSSNLMFPMVQADNHEGVFICTDSVDTRRPIEKITTEVIASEKIEYGKSYTFECHSDLLRVIWYFRDVDNKQYLVQECTNEENCHYSYYQIERPSGSVELILRSAMLISHERMFDCKDSNGIVVKKVNPKVVAKYDHLNVPSGKALSYRCPLTDIVDENEQYFWQYENKTRHARGHYKLVEQPALNRSQWQQYDCDEIHSTLEFFGTSSVVFRCIMARLHKPVWIINVTVPNIDYESQEVPSSCVENNTTVIILILGTLLGMTVVIIIIIVFVLGIRYHRSLQRERRRRGRRGSSQYTTPDVPGQQLEMQVV